MPEREGREVLFGNREEKDILWQERHFFGTYGEIRQPVRKVQTTPELPGRGKSQEKSGTAADFAKAQHVVLLII